MHAAFEQDRAEVVRRMGNVAANLETVHTPTDWRHHVGAKRDKATMTKKRQALQPLGVEVRVSRTGTADDGGNPLQR
jgi:hypothetical protein